MLLERTITQAGKRHHKHKLISKPFDLKRAFRLIDYLTFAYLGILAVVLVFFHRGVQHWPLIVVGHFFFIAALTFVIKFSATSSSRILRLFRDGYPFLLYTFLFEEVNALINIFFPFWLEGWLIKWDYFLFGNHPTVWLQKIYRPWLTEVMAFSYWSYYILIPFGGILLYLRRRKQLFHSFVFNLSFTLYTCYLSFLFLTARGPHETLAQFHVQRAPAGFFDHLVRTIQEYASISGAAFPSSHVTAVWIVLIFMFKYKRALGLALLPLILTLSVAVVYMQYHYAVDSIAGIILVCLTYPLGRFLEKRYDRRTIVSVSK
ncbi:MAG: phosphatase PAP2 family protein [bacterium]